MIETKSDLEQISRDCLSSKIPVLALNVLKPLLLAPGSVEVGNEISKAFQVVDVVRGAKRSDNTGGKVFKFLERHNGHYFEQEGIQIYYKKDDWHIHVHF